MTDKEVLPNGLKPHSLTQLISNISGMLLKASQNNCWQYAKRRGNEAVRFWMKGIRSHLYWSLLSTELGFGDLIVAKWTSITEHIANKHDDHPNPMFTNCAHGEIAPSVDFKTCIGKKSSH